MSKEIDNKKAVDNFLSMLGTAGVTAAIIFGIHDATERDGGQSKLPPSDNNKVFTSFVKGDSIKGFKKEDLGLFYVQDKNGKLVQLDLRSKDEEGKPTILVASMDKVEADQWAAGVKLDLERNQQDLQEKIGFVKAPFIAPKLDTAKQQTK